jgi:four helix bundle protein
MGVNRFEDLRVWQAAKALSDGIGRVLRTTALGRDFVLRDQLNAAALSVVANIAEGFARRGSRDFARFVRIAAGSNNELRALLHAAQGRGYLPGREYGNLVEASNDVGRMLRSLEAALNAQVRNGATFSGPRTDRNRPDSH